MFVPVLGYFIDVEEAIIVLCVVIVAYLAVMHVEFKQLKLVSRKFSKEDTEFTKCLRELKTDLSTLSDVIRTKELKTISSHVAGTAAQAPGHEPETSKDESSAPVIESKPEKDTDTPSTTDTSSLKDMLDKV
ncbi:MAG: hypothetical protein DRP85_06960 [Candidatus Makaraimicrobium thalassicum]|nr:MAG: hypothetical protein DRP85_06960 [Candidatus Omnitrophota bacterium]